MMLGLFRKKGDRPPKGQGPARGPVENMQPQPMNRSVSRWYIILSVLYVIVGIIMVAWPNATVSMIGTVIGVGMLVSGVTRVIIYFTRNHMLGIVEMDLTLGVTFAAFGAFMLLHKETVETMLPFAVAILLMIGAISKLQYALDMKQLSFRYWKVFLLFTILIMALGVILICDPFSESVLLIYMAVSLMIEGVLNILAVLMISHRLKRMANSSFTVADGPAGASPMAAAKGSLLRKPDDMPPLPPIDGPDQGDMNA